MTSVREPGAWRCQRSLATADPSTATPEQLAKQELYHACVRGSVESVVGVLDAVPPLDLPTTWVQLDPEGSSALHLAARYGHLRLLQELVQRGCPVTAVDSHNRTPLHVASLEGQAEVALELLMASVDPNAFDVLHETALHKAVLAHSPDTLQVLLEHGRADVHLADGLGCTPALLAAERGKPECLEVLLARDDTVVNSRNSSLWTPLHLAAHGHQHQRSITTGKPPKYPPTVQMLLEAKADVNAKDEDTKTPLHRAACTGNVDSAHLLIGAGAELAAADNCRWTPLHYACQEGHVNMVRLLCKAGAKVQCDNPPCLTPLAVATLENHPKVAELLMSYGADPNKKGKGLASPAMIARKDPEKLGDILALFELGFVSHK